MNVVQRTVFFLALLGSGPAAAQQVTADRWQFGVTPYLWLPTISGELKYDLPPPGGGGDGGRVDIDVGPTDWLDLLNFAALVGASASKGRYLVAADLVYLSMAGESDGRVLSVEDPTGPGGIVEIPVDATLSLSNETELRGLTVSAVLGYALRQTDRSSLHVFAGARYFGLDFESRWNLTAEVTTPGGARLLPASGSIGQDTDLVDAIAGVRGRIALGDSRWALDFSVDAGTGDADLTWNGLFVVGREFSAGDLLFAYRHLEYDQDAGSLVQDFSFSGPGVGFRFRF